MGANTSTIVEDTPYDVPEFIYLAAGPDSTYIYNYELHADDQIEVIFTTYDNVPGGSVEGTFSGTATNAITETQSTISGSFEVPID